MGSSAFVHPSADDRRELTAIKAADGARPIVAQCHAYIHRHGTGRSLP